MAEAGQQPDEAESASTTRAARSKLFLGGLSWEAKEDDVRAYFEQFGEVTEVIIMRERGSERPRGFGFVSFKEQEAADRVVNHPEQHILNGRPIDAKPSVPPDQKPKIRKIFVGGLAPGTTIEQFQQYFEQFGKVVDAQIMQDHYSGRSRGFGFITFEHEDSVDAVFVQGTMHEVCGKRVEVKTATPKGTGSLRQQAAPARGPLGPIMVPTHTAPTMMRPTTSASPGYPAQAYPQQLGYAVAGYTPLGAFPGAHVAAGYPAFPYGPYSPAVLPAAGYYYPMAEQRPPSAGGAGRATSPPGMVAPAAGTMIPTAILPPGGGVYGAPILPHGALAMPPLQPIQRSGSGGAGGGGQQQQPSSSGVPRQQQRPPPQQ